MARTPILDHTRVLFAGLEASFGAGPAAAPAATDAQRHLSLDIPLPTRRLIPNAEITGHRGMNAGIQGAHDPVSIKATLPLIGSGSPTTAPPVGVFLKAAGFTETVAADVTYTRTASPTASAWLTAVNKDGSFGVAVAGATFQEPSFPDLGANDSRIDLSGLGAKASAFYRNAVGVGGLAIGATALPLAEKSWVHGGVDFYVTITDGTDSEVVKVTAVNNTTGVATIVRAQAGTSAAAWDAADAIVPYLPASATTPSTVPVAEHLVSLAVDLGSGTPSALKMIKASLSIKSAYAPWEKEAGSDHINGATVDRYGEDGCRATIDFLYTTGSDGASRLHAMRADQTATQVVITAGTTAGNRMIATLPTARITDCNAPMGAGGPRKGTVIATGYGESDVTLKFN
jgi:hypothetical protein